MWNEQVADIAVSAAAALLMRQEATRAGPAEACGALLGEWDADGVAHIREARALPNAADDIERTYCIAARDVFRLNIETQARGFDIVGFFHSHPRGGNTPSATDLAMAWPGYVYAIVDGATGAIGYWRLADDRSSFHRVLATTPPGQSP